MDTPSPDGPIGVLGEGPPKSTVRRAVTDHGSTVVDGDAATVYAADPPLVITVDPPALRTALDRAPDTPVYPVGIDDPYGATPPALDRVVASLLTGGYTVEHRPVLQVSTASTAVPAVLDATLMTEEPARISEYDIDLGTGPDPGSVRADGVVVATPAGSTGYAAAAGGPTVTPGTEAVSVVPVSPFAVDRPTWVVDPPVTVTVRREEGAVSLYADGGHVATVPRGDPVTVDAHGTAAIATVPPDEKT